MAEKTIIVCDLCGRPAVETITIKTSSGNWVKDLCTPHVNELVSGARKPRPGRRKGVVATPSAKKSGAKRRGRPPKATSAKASAKKSGAKRRGRPPKATSAKSGAKRKSSAKKSTAKRG